MHITREDNSLPFCFWGGFMVDVINSSLGLVIGAFPILMEIIINNPVFIFGVAGVFLLAVLLVFRCAIRLRG